MTEYVQVGSGSSRPLDSSRSADSGVLMIEERPDARPKGFFVRYRMPIILGIIAFCLYLGSILYILYGRGQVA